MPRLYREAPLNSIWEGLGNVICLDILRAVSATRERSMHFSTRWRRGRIQTGASPRRIGVSGRRWRARPRSHTPDVWSSRWLSPSRAPCWSGGDAPRWPMPSAPRGSIRTTGSHWA